LLGVLLCGAIIVAGKPQQAVAQWFGEDATKSADDEDNPYAAGLVATFAGVDGAKHIRLVDGLSHVWNDAPPDRRLAAGPFTATFSGRLWTQAPGIYRLHVYCAGGVRLTLNGKLLLDAHAAEPGWLAAEPIELPFGFHPLEVEYRRTIEPARIGLFWEGPQFGFEPVASRWLLHDREQSPAQDFERGEQLVRGLRCAGCHELPGEPEHLAVPALSSLSGNLSREWLIAWLVSPQSADTSGQRRMPHFAFARKQAVAMADALLSASEPLPPAKPVVQPAVDAEKPKKKVKKKKGDEEALPPPSAELGATLFRSIGCLACHRAGELGTDGLFGGGDLSQVAAKRPADFFSQWLADPERMNRDHRMPMFPLDADQLKSLSLYLQTLGTPGSSSVAEASGATPGSDLNGAQLIQQAGCANCHALPKSLASQPANVKTKLTAAALARDDDSCLGEPAAKAKRPGYRLSEGYRRAIRTYLTGVVPSSSDSSVRSGDQLLTEHNCLACHARGWTPGITSHLPAVAEANAALSAVLPALQPPALHGIGDKLQDDALTASLDAPNPPRRPWLRVRMPKFQLSKPETAAIVDHFVAVDRIPPREATPASETSLSTAALDAAGPRLVTAEGFGCTSCHAIGKWEPQKVALNAQGTALSQIGTRVRREWFDRWVRNPARIVPQMEMPSVQQAVRGVLSAQLDDQLSAVWRVLNREDFTPPNPSALRVVRRANLPDQRESAVVLTDVIEVGGRDFIKPLVIGLDNRHNVLVDLATSRLAAWWIGDAARQQTRGKTWYWEAGMPQLLPVDNSDDAPGDLTLIVDGQPVAPQRVGQFTTEFDTVDHIGSSLQFTHRLHFAIDNHPAVIRVSQTFAPLPADAAGRSGFRRTINIEGGPQTTHWQLAALPKGAAIARNGRSAMLTGPRGSVEVAISDDAPTEMRFKPTSHDVAVEFATNNQSASCSLDYRCEAVPDQFAPLPAIDRTLEPQELAVVPGFDAVRLPTTDEAMPTGLAWRTDGTLLVSSLEGRVWLGRDTDGDGLEDKLLPFGDDLAAPYGIEVAGDAIDVINKYGVLRLHDADGDGQAERTETLASGWGHTRDYHDWAVGLPRDAAGNYYVAIPCEQDDRSEAAAHLRGRALKLIPREPTQDDPRRFALVEICAGLRFPQGIALSPGGELFTTDNQGNYNPFNELNHLVPGARYGFINSLESKRGLNPPSRAAAVEIPHPWTRSVNGLCFLVPPADSPAAQADKSFGPFTGHLIGCEYDTRRMVRMSLERVAGDYQGAVYPFSRDPVGAEPTFEGPLSCRVSPQGDLYIGNIRDSGWGAGSNTGSIVRLRYRGQPAPGIAEVRAAHEGFTIAFTVPVDRAAAVNPASYSIVSYRRISTPAYGGEDVDRRAEKIAAVQVADDAQSVVLSLGELREGFIYEFHLRNLNGGKEFFPAEAYYTLRHKMPEAPRETK
jgi:glucose/arabinose dehydrogenase/cbb3-type cytochrome oxidase cytochrome c subunit